MLWESTAKALLDDTDSLLYVSSMKDHSLLYMNKQCRLMCGLPADDTSYIGKPCYEVLHKNSEPCKHCKHSVVNRNDFFRWTHYDETNEMHYWVKNKLIDVDGEDCYLEFAMHMTEQVEKERAIQRELEKERVLLQCVTTLESAANTQSAMDGLLEIVGRYFNGDRAYLFEFDFAKQVTNNTYEWAGEGVEKEIDVLQNVPLEVISTWIVAFEKHGSFYISDLDENVDRDSDTYRILEMQGIRSLIAVPLEKDNQIIGFFGVDNPRKNYKDTSLLSAITFFIFNTLDKRAYQEKLEKLSYQDSLTGLCNRHKFNQELGEMLLSPPARLGVVYMDLNNLKFTNDNYGHDAGDLLIQTTAQVIRQVFGEHTYRIGGDEFVAFIKDGDEAKLTALIEQMNCLLAQQNANVSVGYNYREQNVNVVEQMDAADKDMYHNKQIYRKLHPKR